MLALVVAAVTGYGTFNEWHGGVSWGPRLLTGVAPMLALGVGMLLQGGGVGWAGGMELAAVAIWGAGISALGAVFDYQSGWLNLWDVGARPEQILWDPHFSVIGAHLRLLDQWRSGRIGLDMYLGSILGFWSWPVFAVALVGIGSAWLGIEFRSRARALGA
ncbi:MAG: hypothetical protein FJ029_00445 [Actinobacteria bacterium]|nr:hypothetical protein [Actinomycetota bacterium]